MNLQRKKELFAPKSLFTVKGSRLSPADTDMSWQNMHCSDAVGIDVLYDTSGEKPFGLGLIRFPPYGEVPLHVHEGSHMLICFDGDALVKVQSKVIGGKEHFIAHTVSVGECYQIESRIPHSIHAGSQGVLLLVVGNDYRMTANHDRLEIVNG